MFEHGAALIGGTGEHDDPDAVGLKGAARGGAPVVGEDGAALGQVGLLEVVVRHGTAGVEPLEVIPDPLGGRLVIHQLLAKALGQHVLGQVVAGGSQAAGGDDDVGPALGHLHRRLQPLGIVPHHDVVVHVDAQGAQPLGEHLGVGVGDVAQEQFGAYCDEFCGMRHNKRPPKRREWPGEDIRNRRGAQGLTWIRSIFFTASSTRASMSRLASAASISPGRGRSRGWRGVNTVQQSS